MAATTSSGTSVIPCAAAACSATAARTSTGGTYAFVPTPDMGIDLEHIVDPYRERGHRLLIEIECNRGDSGAAMQALRRCERVFSEELGIPLSNETPRLAELLHRGES